MKHSLGNTDYKKYLKDQRTRAESKWARKPHFNEPFKIKLLKALEEIRDLVGNPLSICCMGCRDGTELFVFKNFFRKATVLGLDITHNIDSIRLIPGVNVAYMDFNKLPYEWTDRFDLIFSNSLDHAFEPRQTLKEWRRVLKPKGFLFLQLASGNKANIIEHAFDNDDLSLFKRFTLIKTWESTDFMNVLVQK